MEQQRSPSSSLHNSIITDVSISKIHSRDEVAIIPGAAMGFGRSVPSGRRRASKK
jgi:hypothetical protein